MMSHGLFGREPYENATVHPAQSIIISWPRENHWRISLSATIVSHQVYEFFCILALNMIGNMKDRFIKAQDSSEAGYKQALEEMRMGRKKSHWIWYIFPQIHGLGCSFNAEWYAIQSLIDAKLYLDDSLLGNRLREITGAVLSHSRSGIYSIMAYEIDALKFQASMTLFDIVSPRDIFSEALDTFFGGKRHWKTLNIVKDELEYLSGELAIRRHGVVQYDERFFFETGLVESETIPEDVKLATMLDLVRHWETMYHMTSHYLYKNDCSESRLARVASCMSQYCSQLYDIIRRWCEENCSQVEIDLVMKLGNRLPDSCAKEPLDAASSFDEIFARSRSIFDCLFLFDKVTKGSLLIR